MEIVKITARPREGVGKSYIRKARAGGWIPAVYYGHGQQSKAIEVNAQEFSSLLRAKKTTHLIHLDLPGEEGESAAIIKEIQRHVLNRDSLLHIDFQHVRMDEKVTVRCPLSIVGIPLGVTEDHGVLGHPVQALTVECLPADIPEKVTVDVSHLRVGESIRIKELSVPNVVIKDSPEEVIAVVTHATKIEAEAPAVPEGEAAEEGEAEAGQAEKETGEESRDKREKEK